MAQKNQHFLYGINAAVDLIVHRPKAVRMLYVDSARHDKRVQAVLESAGNANIEIQHCERADFDDLLSRCEFGSAAVNHQGILVQHEPQSEKNEGFLSELLAFASDRPQPLLFLILDGVTDPHNLGACLRSGNAAGVDGVIVPKDKAVGLTAVVRKVASGAAETTPLIVVKNLARCITNLQERGVWVMGAAGQAGCSLYDIDLTANVALVMGSEGSGLRRLTRDRCDQLFGIPMQGTVESLNVSVASGICLFEANRQRGSAQ